MIEAVKLCVASEGLKHVVIASISGRTALRFAKALPREELNVVCVGGPPSWQLCREYQGVCPVPEVKEQLQALGVVVVDRMVSLMDGIDYGCARYGLVPPSWLIMETLVAVGGYGLKTAVEVTVMATDAGAVPPFEEVLAVAGTEPRRRRGDAGSPGDARGLGLIARGWRRCVSRGWPCAPTPLGSTRPRPALP